MLCNSQPVSAPPELPPLVSAALSLSGRRGFVSATRNETGRLLATLAASRTGTLGEVGTGCGVGSAWLRHGATDSTKIVTAESDPQLAKVVAELFADDGRIEVVAADWTALIERGPFSLLFVDAREAKLSARDVIAKQSSPAASSYWTTSPRRWSGRPCTRAASTRCARNGSRTNGSPPSR